MTPASYDTRASSPLTTAQDELAALETAHGSRLTIDTSAIAANWRLLQDKVGGSVTCAATIKSDAYGCGTVPVARALAAAGCSTFFVALPQEGILVRQEVPNATIYILNGLIPGAAPLYAEAMLRPVLGSIAEIEEWALFCSRRKVALEAAIHVDTGMNRLGLTHEEARRLEADPAMLGAFRPSLIMSHLSCGSTRTSPFSGEQLARFRALDGLFAGVPRSLANSAGVFLGPEYHFDLVRPGIALYGGEIIEEDALRLSPVIKLEARILQVRQIPEGEGVGYGRAQRTARTTRLAVLSIGYGDGYHRLAGSADGRLGAHGMLAGYRVPLFGRVSMDLVAVDVTDVPADLARRGAYVQLYGPEIDMADTAQKAGTIDYELLTSLGRRYHRVYAPLTGISGEDR